MLSSYTMIMNGGLTFPVIFFRIYHESHSMDNPVNNIHLLIYF